MKLGGRDQIPESDQTSVRSSQPDDSRICRESYVRIEAGLRHVMANGLQIGSRRSTNVVGDVEDQLIDA